MTPAELASFSETSTPVLQSGIPGDNNNVPGLLAALLNPVNGPGNADEDVDRRPMDVDDDTSLKHAPSAMQLPENPFPAKTPSVQPPIPEKVKNLRNGNEREATKVAEHSSLTLGSKKRPASDMPNKHVQIRKVAKIIATGDVSSGQRRKPRVKTAIWERLQNLKYERGEAESASSAARFRSQILELDKYAVIEDSKSVRHFKCGKTFTMKYPFNTRNFETHIANWA